MSDTSKFRHEINNYLAVIYSELQTIEEKHQILMEDQDWITIKQDTLQLGKMINSLGKHLKPSALSAASLDSGSIKKLENKEEEKLSEKEREKQKLCSRYEKEERNRLSGCEREERNRLSGCEREERNRLSGCEREEAEEIFSIHPLLQSLSHSWKLRYSQKGFRLSYINQTQDTLKIKGIPSEIIQIFNNLLSNSYDALWEQLKILSDGHQESSWFPEASLILAHYKNQIVIRLVDNGCGIAKDNISHIFEYGVTTKSSGHGIGLAVVEELVKKYHGHIYVRSKEGTGCDFHLIFPAVLNR